MIPEKEANRHATHEIRPDRAARLAALPRHHDLRPAVRRGAEQRHPRCGGRGRDRLPRHRRRLSAGRRSRDRGPHRGDRRQLAEGQAPPVHPGHQVRRPDGAQAVGPGHVAQAHPRCDRRLAAAARHRLRRSLPAARLRPAHAASTRRSRRSTRSCARARRATSASPTGRPTRWRAPWAAARSRARSASTRVQPRYNLLFRGLRARPAAAVRGGGDRGDSLQSAGRRAAHRQARSECAAARGLALRAGHCRPAIPGTLLARTGVRDHRAPARRRRRRRA